MSGTGQEYTIDLGQPGRAVLRGVLRLESPAAYGRLFRPIAEELARPGEPYTIDVREVVLMNSSGIRALGTLVLAARGAGRSLVLAGRRAVPWQRKTMSSLAALFDRVEIRLE